MSLFGAFSSTSVEFFMPLFLKNGGAEVHGDIAVYRTMFITNFVGLLGIFMATWLVETRLGRRGTYAVG